MDTRHEDNDTDGSDVPTQPIDGATLSDAPTPDYADDLDQGGA